MYKRKLSSVESRSSKTFLSKQFYFSLYCILNLCIKFHWEKEDFLWKMHLTEFLSLMIVRAVPSFLNILMNVLGSNISLITEHSHLPLWYWISLITEHTHLPLWYFLVNSSVAEKKYLNWLLKVSVFNQIPVKS